MNQSTRHRIFWHAVKLETRREPGNYDLPKFFSNFEKIREYSENYRHVAIITNYFTDQIEIFLKKNQ